MATSSSAVTGEFRLIQSLAQRYARPHPTVLRGIGDDAAVIAPAAGRQIVLTTDLLAEGVHFDLKTASFEDVGYKAAIANLSDVAAMGARPEHLLVALALPHSTNRTDVLRLYKGLMAACRPSRVALIGGDTSASASGLFLSLTVTGSAPSGSTLLRNGARAGDLIYVTGTLGDSLAGLRLLSREGRKAAARLDPSARRFLIARHRRPIAHCRLGQLLSRHRLASAAIDLSDGLSGDLRHICTQSKVGAAINISSLPLSPALRAYARATRTDPAKLALQGGEDYELLFTVPPSKARRLERLAAQPGRRLTRIGVTTPVRSGLRMIDALGRSLPLPNLSYDHFRSPARRPTPRSREARR